MAWLQNKGPKTDRWREGWGWGGGGEGGKEEEEKGGAGGGGWGREGGREMLRCSLHWMLWTCPSPLN